MSHLSQPIPSPTPPNPTPARLSSSQRPRSRFRRPLPPISDYLTAEGREGDPRSLHSCRLAHSSTMPLWRVPTSSSSPSLAASSSVLLGVLLATVVANAKVFLRPAIFTSSRSELLLPTPIEARSRPAPTNATTPSTHKNCRSRLPATLLHQAPHRQPRPP